ncbi:MAG: sugar ABC transporter ATP-binding protein, partial [Traorella sp.]
SFPGVQALNKVNLEIKKGSVHALMGENGAGKSTLMKCLFGIYKKDEGKIFLHQKEVSINDTKDALRQGIAMVHQELQSIPDRSIAENIYCGKYPMKKIGFLNMIDHKKMNQETDQLLKEFDIHLSAKTKLSSLSVSQRQSIEIVKAVSYQASLIIMDEPTSSLSEHEVDILFQMIHKLKEKGTSVIYISHKIEEILKISDEISIMRDGLLIQTMPANECTLDLIIQKMVGRTLTQRYPPKVDCVKETILQVHHLSSIDPKSFQDVSFELKEGEILGIGGLVGAQRSELVEGIFGLRKCSSGKIVYHGEELKIQSPKDAIRFNMAYVSEERREKGIFGVLNILDNVGIASLNQYLNFKLILNQKKLTHIVQENIEKLQIKTPSSKSLIQNLSGGNQQKVILARWLVNHPSILILDEPTRGIDVKAKYEIYKIMRDLVQQGKSILMISSEMSELLGMSDRILVMCEGKVSGLVNTIDTNQEEIMTLATLYR